MALEKVLNDHHAPHYDWVLSLREQGIRQNMSFEFRQCGTQFIKDGKAYTFQKKNLCSQARKANIDYKMMGKDS